MKRLGIYTGRIYDQEELENRTIHECSVSIQDTEAADTTYIEDRYMILHTWCTKCSFCQESKKENKL